MMNFFLEYIHDYLILVLEVYSTLFALDLMGSHNTPPVFEAFHQHSITPSLIPTSCTSFVQPLNVSINKSLKEMTCDLTNQAILDHEEAKEIENWTIQGLDSDHSLYCRCFLYIFYRKAISDNKIFYNSRAFTTSRW